MNFSWKEFAAGYILSEASRGFIYQIYRNSKYEIANNTKLFADIMVIVDVNKGKFGLSTEQMSTLKTFIAGLGTERRDELLSVICSGSDNLPEPYDKPICRGIVMVLYLIEQGSVSEMDNTINSWGIVDNTFFGALKKFDNFLGKIVDAIPDYSDGFGIEDPKESKEWGSLYSSIRLQMLKEGIKKRSMKGMHKLINKKKIVKVIKKMGRTPKSVMVEIDTKKRLPFFYRDVIDED